MAEIPEYLMVHTVSVETYVGEGAYGPIFDTAEDVRCLVEDSRRVVRNSEGDEVVSESTIYAMPAKLTKFTDKTKVILPSGRRSLVILVKDRDDGGLGAPQHVEVNCS